MAQRLNVVIESHKQMKAKFIFKQGLLLLLLLASIRLAGQQNEGFSLVEKVNLITDRSFYISGEQVWFKAWVSSFTKNDLPPSGILYIEIISPDGKSISRVKSLIEDSQANGFVEIPDDVITGTYYVRAYTKYMRNAGPESFACVGIRIVNPQRKDFLSGSDTMAFQAMGEVPAVDGKLLVINHYKQSFQPNEKVDVSVVSAVSQKMHLHELCISVVPDWTSSTAVVSSSNRKPQPETEVFFPEIRGLTISGKLMDLSTETVVRNSRVNLSIIGPGRDFMSRFTDSAGRFSFALPAYTGYRDLFIGAEKSDLANQAILVDNDFCAMPVRLPEPEFRLSPDERKLAIKLAANARLNRIFKNESSAIQAQADTSAAAFYGTPTDVLKFEDYIQLPTLEEYFNELPGLVKVRKRNGQKYFKVIGDQPEMLVFDPLVLVDWVAVDDPEKILAAAPTDILRIEVVNLPYVKGDLTFGGIISIISKKGDFAGVDLPSSGIFLNYLFLQERYTNGNRLIAQEGIPDARNTIYWNPALVLNHDGSANFSFITPETPGKYAIVIKCLTDEGELFSDKLTIEVKPGNGN